ncbi:MAG: hypothetical protein V1851_03255 [Patescibacteria group bacterium]
MAKQEASKTNIKKSAALRKELSKRQNQKMKILTNLGLVVLPVVIIMFCFNYFIEMKPSTTVFCGLALFFISTSVFWNQITFEVPEYTLINTLNYFTGDLTTYMPGFYAKDLWEIIKPSGIISLMSIKEDFTEDQPASDGILLIAKLMFQYRPNPLLARTFQGVENAVINDALKDEAKAVILRFISEGKTPEEIKLGLAEIINSGKNLPETIVEIINFMNSNDRGAEAVKRKVKILQDHIKKEFGVDDSESSLEKDGEDYYINRIPSPIEGRYGILLEVVSLNDLNYEPEYQKMLNNQKMTEKIQKMVDDTVRNNPGMDKKEAWSNIMAIMGKTTKYDFPSGGNALLNIGGK